MHQMSKHWHLMDYIIARHRDINDIQVIHAIREADCWSYHEMLHCKAAFQFTAMPKKQPGNEKKKLHVDKLKDPKVFG